MGITKVGLRIGKIVYSKLGRALSVHEITDDGAVCDWFEDRLAYREGLPFDQLSDIPGSPPPISTNKLSIKIGDAVFDKSDKLMTVHEVLPTGAICRWFGKGAILYNSHLPFEELRKAVESLSINSSV